MQLTPLIAATDAVASVAELRKQLELGDDTSHDDHLVRLIASATEEIERITRRSLLRQKWRLEVRNPCGSIELPRPPLNEVIHVWFKDTLSGDWTADLDGYELDDIARPAIVRILRSAVYIQIEYWAGHDDVSELGENVRDAVIQLAAFKFEFRGDAMGGGSIGTGYPIALRMLIDSLKVGTIAGYYS